MVLPGCQETATGIRIDIRVIPRSSRNAIMGVRDGRWLIRVTAPPVDGAANAAVVALVAKAFGLPKGHVAVVSGEASRNKVLDVSGLAPTEARRRLSAILS